VRIAIIHPYLYRLARGIERFVVDLSAALASNGVRVDILTWSWRKEVVWKDISQDVKTIKMPYIRFFADKFAIMFYVLQLAYRRYDMVIVFFAGYGESAALRLLRFIRCQPYCVVFHFPIEQVPHRYEEFARHHFAHKADILIAVSEHTATGVRRFFERDCRVVYNGTDPRLFARTPERRALGRLKLSIQETSPVIITLAALEERKGIQWVVRALPILSLEFTDIKYVIVGEGLFRIKLESLVTALGVDRLVKFIGSSDEVVTYLAAADVGCLLSTGEASPLALFEYMSMGLPSVTSFREPFPEVIAPEWGIMVDESDSYKVAESIAGLLRDKALRGQMGIAAREEILNHHTWPKVADDYQRILQECTNANTAPFAFNHRSASFSSKDQTVNKG